jgi:hypothetical protein
MPVALQYKKTGGSAIRLTQTFLSGEAFLDTDVDGWFIGDSVTPGGLQVANAHISVISVATQTIANSDAGKLFIYTNSAGCGVALGAPGGGGGTFFPRSVGFWALNNSTGLVVITVTGATINGSTTLTLNPFDSAVIVSDGTNYFALVERDGISALTPSNIQIVGNTTGATSSSTVFVSGSTLSAAGGVSAGFSAGTLVFSNPSVNATENVTALGNTTASTSATSFVLGSSVISGAGDLSVGFQGSSLVLSAPAGATSTTARNAVGIGNTTGATSSTVLTLTNMSISGAAGVTVGFSTTAAGAGVLIVSQAPIGGTTTGRNWSAIGNTTGATSSSVLTISQETYSFAGILSGGFSNGTVVVSGSIAGAPQYLSFFEPRPLLGSSSVVLSAPNMYLAPIDLPARLTFNRVRVIATLNVAFLFGPGFTVATTGVSDTLTCSASYAQTLFGSAYSQVNSTQMTTFTSGSLSTGFLASASVSRSGSSMSWSSSLNVSLIADTGTSSTQVTTSGTLSTTAATMAVTVPATSPITSFLSGNQVFVLPISSSMSTGIYAMGVMQTTGSGQGSMSTGASFSAMALAPIGLALLFNTAIGNANVRTRAGQGAVLTAAGHPVGAGVTAVTNASSYNLAAISTSLAAYAYFWHDLYLGS